MLSAHTSVEGGHSRGGAAAGGHNPLNICKTSKMGDSKQKCGTKISK